jgi:arsenate reductase
LLLVSRRIVELGARDVSQIPADRGNQRLRASKRSYVEYMAPLTPTSPTPQLTLLHDPDSATSEYALQALHLGSQQFDVRHVTLSDSLDEAELTELAERLVGDPVDALVHRGAHYRELGLDLDGADTATVVETLVTHPELLEAPILDDGTAAMIGSPRERSEAWAVCGHVVDARPA